MGHALPWVGGMACAPWAGWGKGQHKWGRGHDGWGRGHDGWGRGHQGSGRGRT
jgi:hypothetical protein